ncbi:hypothetical protein [Methylobacterium nodulans]|uniref:Uncharacterized protein n=1 Tax=Methylobacterium nodulans (strain LMG 21967 / CNCM I-2342 / ORS 2060) TaxID=460265 RepID=B8IE13_METNO|nr:hypothetical protein [Methylobacterium nodulans]ACL57559.1 hypothetical protein Mnod_2596 [Methylobacterium nodulans ORS 2060]
MPSQLTVRVSKFISGWRPAQSKPDPIRQMQDADPFPEMTPLKPPHLDNDEKQRLYEAIHQDLQAAGYLS